MLFSDIDGCSEAYDGLLNTNVLNSFRGMLTTMETLIENWRDRRYSDEKVKELLNRKNVASMIATFESLLEIYYIFSTVNYADTIKAEITSYGNFLAARKISIYSIIGIMFFIVAVMVVVPI